MLGEYAIADSWGNLTAGATQLTVYFGRKRVAVTDSSGTTTAFATDRLGSSGQFYPYGEGKGGNNPADTWSFATYWTDSVTGLDYANRRYFSSQFGRFITPDPYGPSAHLGVPQSWNRYGYTLGDPVNGNDPSGLDLDLLDDNGSFGGVAYGEGDGGYFWAPTSSEPDMGGLIDAGLTDYTQTYDVTSGLVPPSTPVDDPGSSPSSTTPADTEPSAATQPGFGFGVFAGGAAEAGVGVAGASAQGSAGAGFFVQSNTGVLDAGAYASGGATAYDDTTPTPTQVGAPQQPQGNTIVGGYVGAGAGVYVTNAGNAAQLTGPFNVITANLSFGGGASVSLGTSGSTWFFSISIGPGFGASFSLMTTTTAAAGSHTCVYESYPGGC